MCVSVCVCVCVCVWLFTDGNNSMNRCNIHQGNLSPANYVKSNFFFCSPLFNFIPFPFFSFIFI